MIDDTQYIVVVGSYRSGTNLLCSALSECSDTSCLYEIFQVNNGSLDNDINKWRKWVLQDIFGRSYFPFIYPSILPHWPAVAGDWACTRLFEEIISGRCASDIRKEISVKSKFWILKVLFQQCPPNYDTWENILTSPNVHIVYITRDNPLDIVISGTRAFQAKEWFIPSTQEREPQQIEVYLQPHTVLKEFVFLETCHSYMDVWLSKFDNVTRIRYEDILENGVEELQRVAQELGMEGKAEIVSKKQILNKHLDCVSNLPELRGYFEGTKWESLFDEQ
jgi:LPS sulfotransferase NodH